MDTGHVSICQGTNQHYVVRVREHGVHKYLVVSYHRTYRAAIKSLLDKFSKTSTYKRGDVLMLADYCEPVQLCEIVRKP